jgi:membrane protease YdiL (CAAX protease family)
MLILAASAQAAMSLLVNGVLFRGSVGHALLEVNRTTGGLVQATLVGSCFNLAVICLIIFAFGRLGAKDVGWRARALGPGMVATMAFWTVMQGILATVQMLRLGGFAFANEWSNPGMVIGALLAQLLGNALTEETVFRGFFLPQLHRKASRHFGKGLSAAIALIGSQALFALHHIPNRIFREQFAWSELFADQLMLLVAGLVFAAVYLSTRNLFVSVGLHSLANTPTSLVVDSLAMIHFIWFGLVLLVVILWQLGRRFRARVRVANQDPGAGLASPRAEEPWHLEG